MPTTAKADWHWRGHMTPCNSCCPDALCYFFGGWRRATPSAGWRGDLARGTFHALLHVIVTLGPQLPNSRVPALLSNQHLAAVYVVLLPFPSGIVCCLPPVASGLPSRGLPPMRPYILHLFDACTLVVCCPFFFVHRAPLRSRSSGPASAAEGLQHNS